MLNQHLVGTLLRESCPVENSDLELINQLPNPPLVKLTSDDIHVRRCRLASDQVDSRFGRFRHEDLPQLLNLVSGAPVLIGHDKRTLGVARFFGGSIENREEVSWVIPKFYWPKGTSQSDDLRIMIDSGVYNEASIAFVYRTPICSICGKDLRSCAHWPGREYDGELCFFYYDGIERVTEGSLVYRGAAPGTGMELNSDDRSIAKSSNSENKREVKQIKLKHHGRYYLASLILDAASARPVR